MSRTPWTSPVNSAPVRRAARNPYSTSRSTAKRTRAVRPGAAADRARHRFSRPRPSVIRPAQARGRARRGTPDEHVLPVAGRLHDRLHLQPSHARTPDVGRPGPRRRRRRSPGRPRPCGGRRSPRARAAVARADLVRAVAAVVGITPAAPLEHVVTVAAVEPVLARLPSRRSSPPRREAVEPPPLRMTSLPATAVERFVAGAALEHIVARAGLGRELAPGRGADHVRSRAAQIPHVRCPARAGGRSDRPPRRTSPDRCARSTSTPAVLSEKSTLKSPLSTSLPGPPLDPLAVEAVVARSALQPRESPPREMSPSTVIDVVALAASTVTRAVRARHVERVVAVPEVDAHLHLSLLERAVHGLRVHREARGSGPHAGGVAQHDVIAGERDREPVLLPGRPTTSTPNRSRRVPTTDQTVRVRRLGRAPTRPRPRATIRTMAQQRPAPVRVKLSNPDKVLFPDDGITKAELRGVLRVRGRRDGPARARTGR